MCRWECARVYKYQIGGGFSHVVLHALAVCEHPGEGGVIEIVGWGHIPLEFVQQFLQRESIGCLEIYECMVQRGEGLI